MAEYIKREALVHRLKSPYLFNITQRIFDIISEIPAADVAPVVRCKDCVHWDDDPDTYGADDGPKGKCMKSFETMRADDFCSYGERNDGGNADENRDPEN